ncbi:MAG: ATP-binding protein, partial [Actinobacteria bacterium]|nr:ATP-binding protein [Actinomycetota bacterium]
RWASAGAAVEIGIQVSFSQGSAWLHFGLVPDQDYSYRVTAEHLLVRIEGDGVEEYSYSIAEGRVQEVGGVDERLLVLGRESDPQELMAPEVLPAINERTELVADALSMIRAVNPAPDAMRVPREETADQPLSADAGNAATVLRALQSWNSDGFQKVEDYLRAITPSIGRIDIAGLGSWALLTFLVGSSASPSDTIIEARSMSDGTLHALGSLIALFDTGASVGHRHYIATVGLEEPESALHPAAVGVLMDAIRDAADDRQVVVTSHSPDLLDIPVVEVEEILAVRWVEGRTVVDRLDEAGLLALRDQLFSPGQLMRSDQLQPRGGPWNWRSA